MVPGFTLRESQSAEVRRQELLALVAAERRARQNAVSDQRRSPVATAFEFATLFRERLRTIARVRRLPRPLGNRA
jgi:hypothetical protein